jgi:hypothetical protein
MLNFRKLVDRLENMKRNANQSLSSPNRCALCGDYFCLIRSTPNQCGFCQKILCNKCCVDTHYNVDDDTMTLNGTASNSRRNSITSINNAPSNSNKVVVYLCRLCSEQREVNTIMKWMRFNLWMKFNIFSSSAFSTCLVSKKIWSLVSQKISKLYIECRKVQLNF